MTDTKLISWIGYWDRASDGPSLKNVKTLADMVICRTFNSCMRLGVVANVSDEEMFESLQQYREAAS